MHLNWDKVVFVDLDNPDKKSLIHLLEQSIGESLTIQILLSSGIIRLCTSVFVLCGEFHLFEPVRGGN